MVNADFSGNFLNAETCHNEDVGVVLGEGEVIQKKSQKGQDYVALNLPVEVNSKKMIYTVFSPVGKVMQSKWGLDSKDWIGKRFKCLHVNYVSYGQKKVRVDIEPLE